MWDQLLRLVCSARTGGGLNSLVSTGVTAVLAVGLIMFVVAIIWQIPQVWRQVLAEDRAQRLAKQGVQPSDSHPAPPTSEVPPTIDIPPTSDI